MDQENQDSQTDQQPISSPSRDSSQEVNHKDLDTNSDKLPASASKEGKNSSFSLGKTASKTRKKFASLSGFKFSKAQALVVAVIFALVGGYIITNSFATSPQSSSQIVGISSSQDSGQGYWLSSANGGVFSFGGSKFYGSAGSYKLGNGQQVVGITKTNDGKGYWLVQANGGVFSYGDARYEGNGLRKTSLQFVGMASRSTNGYWLVTSGGEVYTFGSSRYKGGANGQNDIVGMAAADNSGYWLVGKNGQVFNYGDAKSYGSASGQTDIVGIASTPDGKGYWLAAANGGVFAFGDALFCGSESDQTNIVGIASTPDGNGYWLVSAKGSIYSFGDAPTSPTYGSARVLSPAFLGFNAQQGAPVSNWTVQVHGVLSSASKLPSYTVNPQLVSATNSLDPENLRYFGGTTANYWDWYTGNYTVPASTIGVQPLLSPVPLSDWTSLSSASNSYPLFDINIMTPTDDAPAGSLANNAANCKQYPTAYDDLISPTSQVNKCELSNQINMLKTAQTDYHESIKYVELGNEFYNSSGQYPQWFPYPKNDSRYGKDADVQVYANKVNYWITQLKHDFPGVEIAIVGAWSPGWAGWNQGIAQDVKGEDAITLHIYFDTGISQYNDVSCKETYCVNQVHFMLANTANGGLSQTTGSINAIASNFASLHKRMPRVWVTEWNMNGSTVTVQDSWIQGLVEAQYALDLVRISNVELTDNHALINGPEYGALFEQSGIKLGDGQYSTTLDATSGGVTLSTLLRSLKGATSTKSLNFPTTPTITGSLSPGVIGQTFVVKSKTNIFLMNLTDYPVTVNIPSYMGSQFNQLQFYTNYKAFISTNKKDYQVQPPLNAISGQVHDSVTLQAYSVSSLVAE